MTSAALNHLPSPLARVPSRAATAARPTHSHAGRAATIIHDQTNDGRRVGRPVGGCDRHTSARIGWTGDLNEIAAVRTRILAGIDRRLAALLESDISDAQSHFQCLSQRLPSHSKTSVRYAQTRSSEAFQIAGNIFQEGQTQNDR